MNYDIKPVRVTKINGTTQLMVNGHALYYAAFRSFRPSNDNVPDFYEKGFKLFCIHSSGIMTALANRTIPYSEFGEVWAGKDEYNWDNLKSQTDMFKKTAPDAYYAAMIDLNTPDWMLKMHPGMRDTWQSLIQTVDDPDWIEPAKRYIKAYIEKLEELLPDMIIGVYLLAGGTTEWYTRLFEDSVNDPSESHKASYGSPVPGAEAFYGSDDGILRNFSADPEALDYMRYYNTVVPDTLIAFAKCAKEATAGRLPVGAFFGYVVSERDGIVRSNYNESQRVFESPDIDIIISPASYDLRKLKSTSGMRVPDGTLTLNNKLYIHEIDAATHLTHNNKFAKLHGVPDDTMHDLKETSAYLRREIGMTLSKGQGFWLFDMFGGWYKDKDMMNEIAKLRKLADLMGNTKTKSVSEVAFVLDLKSNYYVSGDSDYPMFQFQIEELNKMGMPWDCYLTSDLFNDRFDEDRYKLYIFPNLFKVNDKIVKRIGELRSKGKAMLFMHAAGYMTDHGFDDAAMRCLTGIELKHCGFENAKMELDIPDIKLSELDFSHRINAWREKQPGKERVKFNMPPVFEIAEPCEALGAFKENGGVGFGIKERENGGFDAYCACAPIPCDILNALARRAGCFEYCAPGTALYANSALITVYSYTGGNICIKTPETAVIKEYFSGDEYISNPETGAEVRFDPIETKIFLTEPKNGDNREKVC